MKSVPRRPSCYKNPIRQPSSAAAAAPLLRLDRRRGRQRLSGEGGGGGAGGAGGAGEKGTNKKMKKKDDSRNR